MYTYTPPSNDDVETLVLCVGVLLASQNTNVSHLRVGETNCLLFFFFNLFEICYVFDLITSYS